MIRSKVLRRRVLAAVLLYVFAVGSALFWNDWEFNSLAMAINLIAATSGLLILHLRWRAREKEAMTPKKIRDTFQ